MNCIAVDFNDITTAIATEIAPWSDYITEFETAEACGADGLDYDAHTEALAIRAALTALWDMAYAGVVGPYLKSHGAEHSRWQDWSAA